MLAFPSFEAFIDYDSNGVWPPKAVETAYQGNCHCGRFRFRLTHPEIQCVISCSCSICDKLGAMWLMPTQGTFEVTRNEGTLAQYQTSVCQVNFCAVCGTTVNGRHLTGSMPNVTFINVRTLLDVNPFTLRLFRVTNIGDLETKIPREVTITDKTTPIAHTGSCHCGRVKVVLLAPLEHVEIKEDNCSICTRNAWMGAYPTKDQVRIYGREFTRDYQYGRKYAGFPFCTVCGVHVFNNVYGPPQHVLDRIPPERREKAMEMVRKNLSLQPINVRVLDGVDRKNLLLHRHDGGTEGYVLDP